MTKVISPKIDVDTEDMLLKFILNRVEEKLPKGWRIKEVDLGQPEIKPNVVVIYNVEFQFEYFGNEFHPDKMPTARDVVRLAEAVDYFCGAEERKDRIVIDGQKWHIGDGDDSGAVWQTGENRYAMWLRWFAE